MVDSGDTAWMLTATGFVLFMTLPGLALFYGGLVRVSSVLSIFMQCFCICCITAILWYTCGYSLAFSDGGSVNEAIGGFQSSFLMNVHLESEAGSIPESVFFMFQMTFAIIAPALIIGAYPERIKFLACLAFSGCWVMLIYVPVCHWIWGGGWLATLGVMDFAGGIVIHCTAGVSALVVAWYLGPRTGFPGSVHPPHNPVLTAAGACMLWVGWFGFNAGSAAAADKSAGMAMACTHIAAASAALSWAAVEMIKKGKPSSVGAVTGMVAGLAAVTPASGYIGPLGALVLGILGGVLCEYMTHIIKDSLLIDDSLDVFAVHGVGGMIGSVLVVFLAHPSAQGLGGLSESIWYHLGVQSLSICVVCIWSFIGSWLILIVLDKFMVLRTSNDEEAKGLDDVDHGENGYGFNPWNIWSKGAIPGDLDVSWHEKPFSA